jgi:O-antigen/teichoic acid export membrane protein
VPVTDVLRGVTSSEVGAKARSGAKWSVAQTVGRNVVSIGSTAVLARLLSPGDYGLLGMVATLTALLLVFSDMGLSWATVQKRDVTMIQVSNLFWINVGTGALLWGVCLGLAVPLAQFYARPELVPVTAALGASFLLSGVAVQPIALLQRAMRFDALAKTELAGAVVAALAAILSAQLGCGYWALVIQALAGQAARLIGGLVFSGFVPQRPRSDAETAHMVRFGGLLALNGVLIYFARNLDNVLIGKLWGSEQLGYYTRAYFLMLLPSTLATGVLTGLMVPSLAALHGHPERFGSAYRRAVRLIAFVGAPIAAELALVAPEAVRLVYGERWAPVVPIVTWLSVAGITQPVYNTMGWLFTSSGRATAFVWTTLVNAIVLSAVFFVAAPYGALAVAIGYAVVMGLLLPGPALWAAHWSAGIPFLATIRSILPVFACVAAMAVCVASVRMAVESLAWQLRLASEIAGAGVVYGAFAWLFLRPMLQEDFAPLLRSQKTKNAAAPDVGQA